MAVSNSNPIVCVVWWIFFFSPPQLIIWKWRATRLATVDCCQWTLVLKQWKQASNWRANGPTKWKEWSRMKRKLCLQTVGFCFLRRCFVFSFWNVFFNCKLLKMVDMHWNIFILKSTNSCLKKQAIFMVEQFWQFRHQTILIVERISVLMCRIWKYYLQYIFLKFF